MTPIKARLPILHWARLIGAFNKARNKGKPTWRHVARFHIITITAFDEEPDEIVLVDHFVDLRESSAGERDAISHTAYPRLLHSHPVWIRDVNAWIDGRMTEEKAQDIEAHYRRSDERHGYGLRY